MQVLATGSLPKNTCQGAVLGCLRAPGQSAQRAASEQLTQDRAVPLAPIASTRYFGADVSWPQSLTPLAASSCDGRSPWGSTPL